ncbi:phosphatase domain-containing protein [Roseobacter sp. CCS2]|uniref:phosphatase domain-containing protein n=1 Tax=Roseobacter sp. CCS2 TaxID=391593 RepID=UPI0000F3F17C|nr:phosphatase domain-containing protein [Roseobacter sp. CCS2]EBA11167.1 hypothetical protein RCCS2_10360 [Roseobacter sp. CCS2]
MAAKLALARMTHTVERTFDKVRRGPARDDPIIDCYGGYTTATQIIIRGRVLAKARAISAEGPQSIWRNFTDFLNLFYTDELRDVVITTTDGQARTVTDEEGFFFLTLDATAPNIPQIVEIQAEGAAETHHVPILSSHDASFGVISDIDDTLLRTGAFSLLRNLWTSSTGNVHTREIFPDAIKLLQQFAEHDACFFYVSSSPWNLYDYLQAIFLRTGVPRGPFFLRDLGISDTQFITGTHGDHKTDAIEKVLLANPYLAFTLVGDTGQHDPHIYADIVVRHAGRINQVILRRPSDADLPDEVTKDIARIRDAGTPVHLDFDYRKLLDDVAVE